MSEIIVSVFDFQAPWGGRRAEGGGRREEEMEKVSVCSGVRYWEWNSLVSVEFFPFFSFFSGGGPGDGLCARVLERSKGCWLILLGRNGAPRAFVERSFTF